MISSILPTYSRTPLNFVNGKGSWLTEADGRHFLDFGSGIAVNALGHSHPALIKSLTNQANKLWHVSNLFDIPQQKELADKLIKETFADTVFFTNSGTESCELAVKMVRKFWFDKDKADRIDIIGFNGSFHGRSTAGIAASGEKKLTEGFGPLLPGFFHVNWLDRKALKELISETTAAIIIEPIQGEGGIRPCTADWLKELREICDENDLLLIFDEVQCGAARSGKLFASEWSEVSPDIMMTAKGIGGGFPLGAVLATENAASGMTVGTHGSTFGGNPLACAIGNTVFDIISDPKFLKEIRSKSLLFVEKLKALVSSFPDILLEVRGQGLMQGLVCKIKNTDFIKACHEETLITIPAADNVVRLLPPLNITYEELSIGVEKLRNAAAKCRSEKSGVKK